MANDPVSLKHLLDQRDFVVAVARAVLADEALAEDVAQKTLLRAWSTQVDASRGWLATVARRLAWNESRGARRRTRRELATAVAESLPSPERILEIEEDRRRLVEAVIALDEPLRTTVLLRFYEDLPPRAIAARQGVPVETVRTRIKRAQELLRERLLPRDADVRRERVRSLLLLAGSRASDAIVATTGGALVATKMVVAAAVVVVAVSAWWWGASGDVGDARRSTVAAGDEGAAAGRALAEAGAGIAAANPERASTIAAPAKESQGTAAASAPTIEVRGRVVGADAMPIVGARIEFESYFESRVPLSTQSAADGRFAFSYVLRAEALSDTVVMRASARGHVMKRVEADAQQGIDVVLGDVVLARGATIIGRVVDEAGQAIAGASVLAKTATQVEAWAAAWQMGDAGDGSFVVTAADGTFAIEGRAPDWYDVVAVAEGREPEVVRSLPLRADAPPAELVIRMRPAANSGMIEGEVRDEHGAPVPLALVSHKVGTQRGMVLHYVSSDATGRFRVAAKSPDPNAGAGAQGVPKHEFDVTWNDGRSAHAEIAGEATEHVILQLPAGIARTARLVDASTREPVVGLADFVLRAEKDERTRSIEVGPDGMVSLVAPVVPFTIDVAIAGFAPAHVGPVPRDDGGVIDIALDPSPSVVGRVVADGRGIRGATIVLERLRELKLWESVGFVHRMDFSAPETTSRNDGRFRIGWNPADASDQVLVRVFADGYAPSTAGPFTRAQLDATAELVIELNQGGAIEGHVVADDGSVPVGLVIAATRGKGGVTTARVAEDGSYAFKRLGSGDWRVEPMFDTSILLENGFGETTRQPSPANAIVVAGTTTRLDLTVTRPHPVVLDVSVTIDGSITSGVQVELYEAEDEDPLKPNFGLDRSNVAMANVDPAGRVVLAGKKPGRHGMFVVLPGAPFFDSSVFRAVDLAPGTTFTRFDITTGKLTGRLDPPREARVDVEVKLDAFTVARAIAIAGKDGTWSTGPLAVGKADVMVDGEVAATVDVRAGETTEVVLGPK